MNIDGQLMEMKKTKREKINIVEIVTELHSAKETRQRLYESLGDVSPIKYHPECHMYTTCTIS